MVSSGEAFVKGGCGSLIAFAVLGAFVLIIGGRVHIDACGAIALFGIGGGIGLIALWVYNKGVEQGRHRHDQPPSSDDQFPGFPPE